MWLRTVKGGNQDPKLPRGNERGADSTTTNTPGAAPNMVPHIKDSLVSQWINQGLYSGLPQVCTWGGTHISSSGRYTVGGTLIPYSAGQPSLNKSS